MIAAKLANSIVFFFVNLLFYIVLIMYFDSKTRDPQKIKS